MPRSGEPFLFVYLGSVLQIIVEDLAHFLCNNIVVHNGIYFEVEIEASVVHIGGSYNSKLLIGYNGFSMHKPFLVHINLYACL